MKPGVFLLDGESSEKYGVVIQDRPLIETPKRRVNHRSSFGKSGSDPFDEEAYDNTEMELQMYAIGDRYRTASDNRDFIYRWFDSGTYMDFIPYFDNRKVYKVMTTEPPEFTSKYYDGEGQAIDVTLTIKPYKYYVKNDGYLLESEGQVYNTSFTTSLPEITIYAEGDVTLSINGRPFVIQNVAGHIVLDSQTGFAYQKNPGGILLNENSKTFTRKYPYLDIGKNEITWTGEVSKVEIEPRWRTLA